MNRLIITGTVFLFEKGLFQKTVSQGSAIIKNPLRTVLPYAEEDLNALVLNTRTSLLIHRQSLLDIFAQKVR
jgi:hypothetical protein